MLKMTHEILLLWEAQTKLNEYENTTSPGILHKNIVVRENSTDSSTSLLSDVPCIQSLFPFHHLNNHESRNNCSRTYHPESQLKNTVPESTQSSCCLHHTLEKTLELGEASWISLLTQKICNYSFLVFRNVIYFYILTLCPMNLLN